MLVKRVLNQTLKPQRLKVRHQCLISRQNLRRKKRNRKKFKSLKFPNKTLNLMTTASQILKCLMVRDLPFFFFFFPIGVFICLYFILSGKSKESSHFDPNGHGPKQKVLTCLKSSSFQLSTNLLALQDFWSLTNFDSQKKKGQKKSSGGGKSMSYLPAKSDRYWNDLIVTVIAGLKRHLYGLFISVCRGFCHNWPKR